MRKIGSITFVVSCLLILSLFSCGNLASKHTGAILIALPGADAARQYVPTNEELAKAEYEIVLINQKTNRGDKTTVTGGKTVVLDNITPGEYRISITAHVGNGLFYGTSQEDVTVVGGETASSSVKMNRRLQFWNTNDKLEFSLDRIPEDEDSFVDLNLWGAKDITIKPNLQNGNIDKEHWTGCWPFVSDEPITFYLTGTFGGLWHDNISNPISFAIPVEMLNKSSTATLVEGKYAIPDMTTYLEAHPVIDQNAKTMSWNQVDSVLASLGYNLYTNNVWCELQLWIGEDKESGSWFDGTIFQYGDPQWADSEINKLKNGNMSIDEFTWYDHISLGPNNSGNEQKPIQKTISTDIGTQKWFVIVQLIYKPNGEESTYKIVLPGVQSEVR